MAIQPKNKGDEDKVSSSLAKIMEEDPTVRTEVDSELKQQLIYGVGDQHLDVIVNKLKNKFKVEVNLSKPKVSYRETINGKAEVAANIRNSRADTDSMATFSWYLSPRAI